MDEAQTAATKIMQRRKADAKLRKAEKARRNPKKFLGLF